MDDDGLPVMCDMDSLMEDGKRKVFTEDGRKLMEGKVVSKMSDFPLENILKISLDQYLKSKGKEISDYELIGIHTKGYELGFIIKVVQGMVPAGTERVVDYEVLPHGDGSGCGTAYGTALIPKK